MKSLSDYLKGSFIEESKEEKPKSEKYFRFVFKGLKNGSETIDSLKSICQKKEIYFEMIDNGIKIKTKKSYKDKLDSIIDIVQQFVETSKDKDDANEDAIEKLASQLNKLHDWLDSLESDNKDNEDNDKNKNDKEDE
ncbi:MAG: hypothetical protein J6D03_07860 [Clostridia bacterium]|nr:hypothetical protein [Clostridia bacterium]